MLTEAVSVRKIDVLEVAEEAVRNNGSRKTALIAILQEIQGRFGYLPEEGMREVADMLQTPLSQVYGVATFFHQFRLTPKGQHMILICAGTACHINGTEDNYNALRNLLKLEADEDTTKDGEFTLMRIRCMGACGLSPVMRVDEDVYGKVTPSALPAILKRYGGN